MMMTRLKHQGAQVRGRSVLSAAAKGACWTLVLEVLQSMLYQGQSCAPASVCEVTNACGRGSWQGAVQMLQEMKKHHVELTVESFGAVSSSCEKAIRKADSKACWRFSLHCLKAVASKSLRASVISFNSVMATLGQVFQWDHSCTLLCRLRQSELEPDDFSINTLATACEKKFRWEAAVATLKMCSIQDIEVDVIGTNAVISSCGKNGLWQEASTILMDLHAAGMRAQPISFAATASACEKANLWIHPLQLLRLAQFTNPTLSGPVLYGVALDALEHHRFWQKALILFRLLGEVRSSNPLEMDPIAVSAVVLRGFNGTVFAYGQKLSAFAACGSFRCLVHVMVWSIFDGIDHAVVLESGNIWQHLTQSHKVLLQCTCTEAADYIEFVVKVAIVEIYNERMPAVNCCFGTRKGRRGLKGREATELREDGEAKEGLSPPLPGTASASPAPVDEAEKTELEEQLQDRRKLTMSLAMLP
eukprot:Skav211297  [mRNA]  locus=scaffold1746:42363:47543:- [translate_table: standard]